MVMASNRSPITPVMTVADVATYLRVHRLSIPQAAPDPSLQNWLRLALQSRDNRRMVPGQDIPSSGGSSSKRLEPFPQPQERPYVLSLNESRRDLNESQRAMCAARLANARPGERTDLGQISSRFTIEQAAERFRVARGSVIYARAVLEAVKAERAVPAFIELTRASCRSQRRQCGHKSSRSRCGKSLA